MSLKSTISFALGVILATVVNTKAQTAFTKTTAGDLVNDVGSFGGFAWGDFSNDGFLDLFSPFYGGTNVLYRNNGKGAFVKVPSGDPDTDNDYHVTVAAGDFDNDGYLDLLVSTGQGAPTARPNILYRNNGDGTFSLVSGGSITTQLGYARVTAWADYDNDGFLDFFVDNHGDADDDGGRNSLFHNNGNGTFTKITSGAVFNDISVAYGVQWADYDNDGFMDLLVVNNPNTNNGVNFLYHNERNGTFRRVLTNAVATDVWPQGALTGAVALAASDGIQRIPLIYLRVARTLGTPGYAMPARVILPASLPSIVTGLKLGWTLAWHGGVSAELIKSSIGLGFLLQMGRELNDAAQVIGIMVLTIIFGLLLDRFVFGLIQKRILVRWGLAPGSSD